jgi:hypothetical protein
MNDHDPTPEHCPIIDEFIGQGTPTSRGSAQPQQVASLGCAMLTEFIDQGRPVQAGPAPADHGDSKETEKQRGENKGGKQRRRI